jgi:hypothetical protein
MYPEHKYLLAPGQVQAFLADAPGRLKCLVFIRNLQTLPAYQRLLHEHLGKHEETNGRILTHAEFPGEFEHYGATEDPTVVCFIGGRVEKRFSRVSFGDVLLWMEQNEPKTAFRGAGRALGGSAPPADFMAQLEARRRAGAQQQRAPPPPPQQQQQPRAAAPPPKVAPPPAVVAPTQPDFEEGPIALLRHNLLDCDFPENLVDQVVARGGRAFNECCDYIDAVLEGRAPPTLGAQEETALTPRQQEVLTALSEMFAKDVILMALREANSDDSDQIIEWICAYQRRSQGLPTDEVTDEMLWSEVDWIIAGRPEGRLPWGVEPPPKPKVIKPVEDEETRRQRRAEERAARERAEVLESIKARQGIKTAAPAQPSAAPRPPPAGPYQLSFQLPNGRRTEKFDENVTVNDLFIWLRETVGVSGVKLVIPGLQTIILTEEQGDQKLAQCGLKDRRFLLKVEPV